VRQQDAERVEQGERQRRLASQSAQSRQHGDCARSTVRKDSIRAAA
jgi:hypothetical protein